MTAGSRRRPRTDTRLVRRLTDALRRRILTRYERGQRLPAEPVLAEMHGVSRTTLRKALVLLEAEGLVLRKKGSGTYVGERMPRASGTTGMLFMGGATTLLHYIFSREAYRGILGGTDGTERHVHLLQGVGSDPVIAEQLTGRFDLTSIDSLICLDVFAPRLFETLAQQLTVVSVDFACNVPGVSSCVLDHRRNVEVAVGHLWALGHRRIALAGLVEPRAVDPARGERHRGFVAAMQQRRLRPRDEWVRQVGSAEQAVSFMRQWRDSPADSRPTAVVCTDVTWLLGSAAVELGVRVPGELSLLSLGDPGPWLALHSPYSSTTLLDAEDVHLAHSGEPTDPTAAEFAPLRDMLFTSVSQPFREMGRWAMEEVLRRVGRPDLSPQHRVFAGHVIPGNTVSAPAGNSPRTGAR